MKKVLIFMDYFKPAYKAGGPITTILNLVNRLGDEFEFYIVCRNNDIEVNNKFNDIIPNIWVDKNKFKIMYVSPERRNIRFVISLLKKHSYDMVYLNSFFSFKFSIQIMWVIRCIKNNGTKIILAPRGEFARNALEIKKMKKKIYIKVAKIFNIYRNITWQASSKYEAIDIKKIFPKANVKIAPDLTPLPTYMPQKVYEIKDTLKLIFISRISPMKNLDYLLQILHEMHIPISLDIYGPIDKKKDNEYWSECKALIEQLPTNVKVRYLGSLEADKVVETIAQYDFMILLTRGENFGHVIIESLYAGTPVIISNNTPWRGLSNYNVGWDICLEQPKVIKEILNDCYKMSKERYVSMSLDAHKYASKHMEDSHILQSNRDLFSV